MAHLGLNNNGTKVRFVFGNPVASIVDDQLLGSNIKQTYGSYARSISPINVNSCFLVKQMVKFFQEKIDSVKMENSGFTGSSHKVVQKKSLQEGSTVVCSSHVKDETIAERANNSPEGEMTSFTSTVKDEIITEKTNDSSEGEMTSFTSMQAIRDSIEASHRKEKAAMLNRFNNARQFFLELCEKN